jgi:hemerythrin-like metal-binding protein
MYPDAQEHFIRYPFRIHDFCRMRGEAAMDKLLSTLPRRESKFGKIIDREHMEIRRAHQALRALVIEGGGMERILECSEKLIAVTLRHFESEERAMEDRTDAFLGIHRELHADLIDSLEDVSEDLAKRRISAAMALLKLFDGRITHHLEVEDASVEVN